MIWKSLNSLAMLSEIDEASKSNPVLLFKHSTRCSISSMALNRLERSWDASEMEAVDAYYLDLIAFRELSNSIADRYDVQHQSPQVLIIKGGKCVYNDSHMGISYDALKGELADS